MVFRSPLIHIFSVLAFWTNSFGPLPSYAWDDLRLPAAGIMVHLSPEFTPPVLKGIKVSGDNPFHFDFILDKGDLQTDINQDLLKEEATKLIKYFLASLTVPDKDMWVNLSPYEKDRIIPQSFGLTEMGRDLLAEDYLLKQITASLIYPEEDVGRKFWKRVYEEAAKKYGTTNIPVNTFNKVWVVPQKAVVYENGGAKTAYIVESKLKVMMEEDYLALQRNTVILSAAKDPKTPLDSSATPQNDVNALGSQIVREIVIPELTKEVNEGKNFAKLRQVYNSLILATWYKKKIKDSILSFVYSDKNKIAGVDIEDPRDKEEIYEHYLAAFKKGVYNYIKEERDFMTQKPVPRKYFSGGLALTWKDWAMVTVDKLPDSALSQLLNKGFIVSAMVDSAMTPVQNAQWNQFWRGKLDEMNIASILGKTGVSFGIFNEAFRFGGNGNGYRPGAIAIGLGYGKATDEVWMIRNAYGEIIFERRRDGMVVSSSVWVKPGRQSRQWESKGDVQLWEFWSGRINEMNITTKLGKAIKRGTFNERFRFEGNGYKPGVIAIGIDPLSVGDELWIKRNRYGEIIFERKRAGESEAVAAAIWVEKKTEKGKIWENKGDVHLWEFWSGRINEMNITKTLSGNGRSGLFNGGFRFDGNEYPPGEIAIGIGYSKEGDEIWIKRNAYGEVIFERRREGQPLLTSAAVWVRTGLRDKSWENRGKALLWDFWSGRVDELNISEVMGTEGIMHGLFNLGFHFEGNGYQPGDIAIGVGYGKDGDQIWLKRIKNGVVLFERRRSGETIRSAMWLKTKKNDINQFYIWENSKPLMAELNRRNQELVALQHSGSKLSIGQLTKLLKSQKGSENIDGWVVKNDITWDPRLRATGMLDDSEKNIKTQLNEALADKKISDYLQERKTPKRVLWADELLEFMSSNGFYEPITPKNFYEYLPQKIKARVAYRDKIFRLDDRGRLKLIIGKNKFVYNFPKGRPEGLSLVNRLAISVWSDDGKIKSIKVPLENGDFVQLEAAEVMNGMPTAEEMNGGNANYIPFIDMIDISKKFKRILESNDQTKKLVPLLIFYIANRNRIEPQNEVEPERYLAFLFTIYELRKVQDIIPQEIMEFAAYKNEIKMIQAENLMRFLESNDVLDRGIDTRNLFGPVMDNFQDRAMTTDGSRVNSVTSGAPPLLSVSMAKQVDEVFEQKMSYFRYELRTIKRYISLKYVLDDFKRHLSNEGLIYMNNHAGMLRELQEAMDDLDFEVRLFRIRGTDNWVVSKGKNILQFAQFADVVIYNHPYDGLVEKIKITRLGSNGNKILSGLVAAKVVRDITDKLVSVNADLDSRKDDVEKIVQEAGGGVSEINTIWGMLLQSRYLQTFATDSDLWNFYVMSQQSKMKFIIRSQTGLTAVDFPKMKETIGGFDFDIEHLREHYMEVYETWKNINEAKINEAKINEAIFNPLAFNPSKELNSRNPSDVLRALRALDSIIPNINFYMALVAELSRSHFQEVPLFILFHFHSYFGVLDNGDRKTVLSYFYNNSPLPVIRAIVSVAPKDQEFFNKFWMSKYKQFVDVKKYQEGRYSLSDRLFIMISQYIDLGLFFAAELSPEEISQIDPKLLKMYLIRLNNAGNSRHGAKDALVEAASFLRNKWGLDRVTLLDELRSRVATQSGFKDYRKPDEDHAMGAVNSKGGIDLTSGKMGMQVRSQGGEIKFNIDPARFQQLQNAPGFVPVITQIRPLPSGEQGMADLKMFLGINEPVGVDKSA